ncbi:MAG TPA: short-chain dehydrogenase, partial [Chloroflexi bacterium]|nr:short-chain dehydrogenase [Chloroflexota bacterium]
MWSLASGLEGRIAIVTGAAGGIGSACLRAFAGAGTHVVACDVDRARLQTAFASMSREPGHLSVVADLTRPEDVEQLIEQTMSAFGRLDILVHTAAIHLRLPFERVDEPAWQRYMDANLKSAFLVSRAVSAPMRAARWGRIVHFTSLAAFTGGFQPQTSVVYSTTKGAILTMTRSLAHVLAPDNVLVNAVAPGGVLTPMAASLSREALDA